MTNEEAIKQIIDMLAYYTTLNANHRADPLFDVVNNRKDMIALSMAIKALEQEPKTGHWIKAKPWMIDNTSYKWECSECEKSERFRHNYCPSCGCRMVESQESEDEE